MAGGGSSGCCLVLSVSGVCCGLCVAVVGLLCRGSVRLHGTSRHSELLQLYVFPTPGLAGSMLLVASGRCLGQGRWLSVLRGVLMLELGVGTTLFSCQGTLHQ